MRSSRAGSHVRRSSGWLVAAVILGLAGGVPATLAGQAQVTQTMFVGTLPSACAGEVLLITAHVHLVNRDVGPFPEHGNWSNATAVGLSTGTEYRATSVSNLMEPPNDYLTHFTFTAPGPAGVTFTLTMRSPLFGAPTDVIETHCN